MLLAETLPSQKVEQVQQLSLQVQGQKRFRLAILLAVITKIMQTSIRVLTTSTFRVLKHILKQTIRVQLQSLAITMLNL